MTEDDFRTKVRECLLAKDQPALDHVMFTVAFTPPVAARAEEIARQELALMPHDIHEWWEGPCNCTGRLN